MHLSIHYVHLVQCRLISLRIPADSLLYWSFFNLALRSWASALGNRLCSFYCTFGAYLGHHPLFLCIYSSTRRFCDSHPQFPLVFQPSSSLRLPTVSVQSPILVTSFVFLGFLTPTLTLSAYILIALPSLLSTFSPLPTIFCYIIPFFSCIGFFDSLFSHRLPIPLLPPLLSAFVLVDLTDPVSSSALL